ncbi:hypothetical protein GUJ93_ZPchr0010g10809 [Zizania palustris]|uniref:GYF domain-containing protein n=1 Tax=Zizania palustris TaxID=103762 RepID=A0A8J5SZI4_ZIZPA|nr:hypothetical protein GUJ93_ZPchr0010g10809 [Zizania palustris]
MGPNYESAEELDAKKAVDWTSTNGSSDLIFLGRKGTESNPVQDHTQKCFGTNRHVSPPTVGVTLTHIPGAEAASLSSFGIISADVVPEKVWHYKDPSGNVQGPFTVLQLSTWAAYFPHDLRIWLTFESEENSLLLSEVLSKQQNDFMHPAYVIDNNKLTQAEVGQDRIHSSLVETNSTSPIGYNAICSSRLPSPSADCLASAREGPNHPGGTLPVMTSWKPLKDAQTLHIQAHDQVNYSCTVLPSAGSNGSSGSHDEWPPQDKIGEWNNCQDSGGMWSSTTPSMTQSNSEHHPDRCMKQFQNSSKSISLAGYAENLNSQMDFGSHKVHIPTTQQSERDLATSLGTSRPSEFKTSIADPTAHVKHQFSIVSTKPESCSSATHPIEDRDSSSASLALNQSEAPAYSPQSAPVSSNLSKIDEYMNQHKSNEPDASNLPVNDPHKPEVDVVLSPDTQDFERTYPSLTPKLDKEPSKDLSTPVAPEYSATKAHGQSSISFASETPGPPSGKNVGLQPPNETSFVGKRDLKDGGSITQTEQPKQESTTFNRENIAVNTISDTEALVCDVLESLSESYNLHGETPLKNSTPASAEEEQPQCSSPIALSPWGEPSYYQGEAVDSALWGVQDDQSNGMWPLSSPTPTLQPSSGLGTDGKHASCVIEVKVAQVNSAVVETSPGLEEKRIEKALSASIECGEPEQVKPKRNAASSPEDSTKLSGWQPSSTCLDGSAKSSGLPLAGTTIEGCSKPTGLPPSGTSLEWSAKISGVQSVEGGKKALVRQPSGSSLQRSAKASGRQPLDSSREESTKASGWYPSGGSQEGNTKPSGWQPSISIDVNTKASGWQRSNSSPEGSKKVSGLHSSSSPVEASTGSRKASGWHSSSSPVEGSTKASGWQSLRESSKSKVNTTGSAIKSSNSFSTHQTTRTAKCSSEAPRRQGNTTTNTAGCGEAVGNNKSWHSSSGNASRGSQSSHHHDRYSQGSEPRWGSSNHSRRSDHHRQDHGSGDSSRSSSRGQSQRGELVCKFVWLLPGHQELSELAGKTKSSALAEGSPELCQHRRQSDMRGFGTQLSLGWRHFSLARSNRFGAI